MKKQVFLVVPDRRVDIWRRKTGRYRKVGKLADCMITYVNDDPDRLAMGSARLDNFVTLSKTESKRYTLVVAQGGHSASFSLTPLRWPLR